MHLPIIIFYSYPNGSQILKLFYGEEENDEEKDQDQQEARRMELDYAESKDIEETADFNLVPDSDQEK